MKYNRLLFYKAFMRAVFVKFGVEKIFCFNKNIMIARNMLMELNNEISSFYDKNCGLLCFNRQTDRQKYDKWRTFHLIVNCQRLCPLSISISGVQYWRRIYFDFKPWLKNPTLKILYSKFIFVGLVPKFWNLFHFF